MALSLKLNLWGEQHCKGYTASPTSAVKEGGPTVYRNFPAVDGVMATRLDSQLNIVETEENKQGKDDK